MTRPADALELDKNEATGCATNNQPVTLAALTADYTNHHTPIALPNAQLLTRPADALELDKNEAANCATKHLTLGLAILTADYTDRDTPVALPSGQLVTCATVNERNPAGEPPSPRTRVRRLAARARYHPDDVLRILDAGLIAHVGVSTPDGPLVLPMAYGRDDQYLYLHGAAANHLLKTGDGQEVCVTVTHLDGLVMARTPFHNSMNYRSVVVRGQARRIHDEERKRLALRLVTDHVVANWNTNRVPSRSDLRKTLVLEVPLAEASAKIRSGDPIDEAEDIAGSWWAGVVPVNVRFGTPVASADLADGIEAPESVTALSGLTPDERPNPKRSQPDTHHKTTQNS